MSNETGKKRRAVKNLLKTLTPTTSSKRKIRKALEVSEERYKTAFECTGTGMMILEEDMTISLINQRICEMTGYGKQEIEGVRKWVNMVAEQDLDWMIDYHHKRRMDESLVPKEYTFRYKHKSGTLHDALATVSLIPGTTQSLVSLMDISERIGMEKELKESRRRFKETAELLPSIICEIDTDMKFIYVNKIGLSSFGFTQEDFEKGVALPLLIHPDDLQRAKENVVRQMRGEEVVPQEYRLKHKDGSVRDYYVTSSRILRDDQAIGIRTSLMDISDRRQMERQLRASEERLRGIYAASPIGIAVFNASGACVDMNLSFKKMFALPQDIDCCKVCFSLFDHVPEVHTRRGIHAGINFESPNDFKFAENKGFYEIVPTDKRYLDWHITPLEFEQGSPTAYLAQVQDITERKRTEEAKLTKVQQRADEANRIVEGLRKEIFNQSNFQNMVSRSAAMQKIFNVLPEIAQTATTALIIGESGTGKELIARSLHALSPRKDKPFITINCGALPDNLLESELFGYKAGAFTDAKKDKPGKFALAEGGTLFLDEIGDITTAMQVKLLRVLQERIIEPLGATASQAVNVRIVAATNKNLPELVKAGSFREDLYYRIKVVTLSLPPLRERRGDIPLLGEHFISLFNARFKKNIRELSHEALDILIAHSYPGNIRELENIMEHAFIFCKTDTIEPAHLPPEISSPSSPGQPPDSLAAIASFEDLEKMYLRAVLKETGGSRIQAAQRLGIHKATLFRKMKSLGINDA